jgi:predicted nucleotidyltransferase
VPPRLSPLEVIVLEAFASGVRARFGARVQSIVLFGSRARGEGRDDSDLDIFVLLDAMSRQDRNDILNLGADIGLEHRLIISPLVAAVQTWRSDLPLAKNIATDGVPL